MQNKLINKMLKWNDKDYIFADLDYMKNICHGFFIKKDFETLGELERTFFYDKNEYDFIKNSFLNKMKLLNLNITMQSVIIVSGLIFLYKKSLGKYFNRKTSNVFYSLIFLFSYLKYKIHSRINYDLSDIIDINRKFGLYLWYECRFRNTDSMTNLSYVSSLDYIYREKFQRFKNRNFEISKEEAEKVLLYYNLRSHYFLMNTCNIILLKEYEARFIRKFFSWRYYSFRKESIWKKVKEEIFSVFNEDLKNKRLEFPLITEANYKEYFGVLENDIALIENERMEIINQINLNKNF